jgi:metal-responsive CopG/Arc/MetJ family transcriptional regulator
MGKPTQRGITLPRDLVDEVEKVITESPGLGYSSIADFVKSALREKLARLLDSDTDDEEAVKEVSHLLRKQAAMETVLGSRISALESDVRELKRTRSRSKK